MGIFWEHATRSGYIEGTWKKMEYMLGTLELHPWVWLGISQEYFGTISDNILNVIWWVHAGDMLRSQSKCTQNVIGGYIGRKMIRSPQFTQDVPTGFQVTSPPVTHPVECTLLKVRELGNDETWWDTR